MSRFLYSGVLSSESTEFFNDIADSSMAKRLKNTINKKLILKKLVTDYSP